MINFKKKLKKEKDNVKKESTVEKSSDANAKISLPLLPSSPKSLSSSHQYRHHRFTSSNSISSDRSSSRRHVHGHSSSVSSDRINLFTPSSRNEHNDKNLLKKSYSRKLKSSQRRNKS